MTLPVIIKVHQASSAIRLAPAGISICLQEPLCCCSRCTGQNFPYDAIGGYWATTAGGGAATTAVIITNSDITMQPYHQNGQLAIRCVRDK